jgi:histidinol-phosphate phosphatase family protein
MASDIRPDIELVIPTLGRPSLRRTLAALSKQHQHFTRVVVVDDRGPGSTLEEMPRWVTVVRGRARGPAAARNAGWRGCRATWIAFLDDDVVPGRDWGRALVEDLEALDPAVAGSQGRLRVPLPPARPPTDWERAVAGLETARWITADIAYRRAALAAAGGFDERFPAAYREDADLAMRLLRQGWQIAAGRRLSFHPPPPAEAWVSVRRQRGNADDVLMRAVHGRHWRRWADAPSGRLRRHLATAACGAGAVACLAARRPRQAAALSAGWLALTAELAVARLGPGPRDSAELKRMLATSVAIPFAASAWTAWGVASLPAKLARGDPGEGGARAPSPRPEAVLLDRDGTLVRDVPYNGDPDRVEPMPGAAAALERLREAGLPVAVISNQSGIARGLIDADQVQAVNRRVEELLGAVDDWIFCPHGPEGQCDCRKPRPGMVLEAARRLGVAPERCAVIGDTAADVQAAQAAGAAAVLVPTPRTEAEDVRRAPWHEDSIEAAVARLLAARGGEGR